LFALNLVPQLLFRFGVKVDLDIVDLVLNVNCGDWADLAFFNDAWSLRTHLSGTVASVIRVILRNQVAMRFRPNLGLGQWLVKISLTVYPRVVRRNTGSSTESLVFQLVHALALLAMITKTLGMHPWGVNSFLPDKIIVCLHREELVFTLMRDAILDLLASYVVASSHLEEVAA